MSFMNCMRFVTALAALSLAACGIDRGGAPLDAAAEGARGVVVIGPVEGKLDDGIAINGFEIATGSAALFVNGEMSDLSMIESGYYSVVDIPEEGSGAVTTVASEVQFNLPVGTFDAATGIITALGQHIFTDESTRLDASISGLDLADRGAVPSISVSGYRDADGRLFATWLALGTGGDITVTGVARDVSTAMATFGLGDLQIDYGATAVLDLPGGAPESGLRLRVTGTPAGAAGALNAQVIEAAPLLRDDLPAGARISLLGFVTAFSDSGNFRVADVGAELGDEVSVRNGAGSDLAVGRRVLLLGTLDAKGVIVVESMEFLD